MTSEFIFMLTRSDRTVPNARALLQEALDVGVRHIGFKDIGLPLDDLHAIAQDARTAGAVLYLEVVSLDSESEAASAQAAVELEVDVLMGGRRPEIVVPVIGQSSLRYYPFAGGVKGHPSRLQGSISEIVASARSLLAQDGVHGLDLLAYRSDVDAVNLIRQVSLEAGARPVIVAGSIDSAHRIRAVLDAGAAAFTIGSAVLDSAFPVAPDLRRQLVYITNVLQEWSNRTART